MDTIRKWLNKPKADDKSLLARFYHADRALTAVASELDSFDGRAEPDRCSRLVSRLRQGQDKVLSITNRIMEELLGDDRAPRAFRAKFPEEVLQENLAGQLWFGAECLAAGSSILNREYESTAMRPLAQAVTKSLENVRNLLREQCLRNNIPNSPTLKLDINDSATEQLYESLKIFDRLFAEFELCYVSAMVQVKSKQEHEMQELICVLFSETLQRALKLRLLDQDQVDSYDPSLMFSIPRLAIITGLVIYHKGPLNMDMPAEQLSEMFRPFRTILIKIRDLLRTLNRNELYQLEKLLCTNEEIHLKNLNNNINQTESQNNESVTYGSNSKRGTYRNMKNDNQNARSRGNSKLTEKLKQYKEKDMEGYRDFEKDIDEDYCDVVTTRENKISKNDCDQNLISSNSNNYLDNNSTHNKNPSIASDSGNNKLIKNKSKLVRKTIPGKNSRNLQSNHFSNQRIKEDKILSLSTSPTNSISSTSLSATTADISSDWSDDEDNENNLIKNNLTDNNKPLEEFSVTESNSDFVTADCATGFLIPNTNLGNLFQQTDDPLTDNIIASEDEYVSSGGVAGAIHSSSIEINRNDIQNMNNDNLEIISELNFETPSTEIYRAQKSNNNYIKDSPSNDGTKQKENQSKPTIQSSSTRKCLTPMPNSVEKPTCSHMEITDSSDESELLRTITKHVQEQFLTAASTTATSDLNSKSSCDSNHKSCRTSTRNFDKQASDDVQMKNVSNKFQLKHDEEYKNNHKHRRHDHSHHHHHHHHHRNCRHNHQRHSHTTNSFTSSSSSLLAITSIDQTSSATSTNSNERRQYHSRKNRSKYQQNNVNACHNSVEVPSSGDTTSSLSDGDPHEVDLAVKAAGRMKFKSTENLLHRLFVCIAGVADQLQTNFASDLRQILRSVFLINTTPVQEEIKIPEKSKDSADLFEFRPSESDVIQENNGGSNQSIYSAAEEVNPELDNVFVNEVSPNQSMGGSSDTSSSSSSSNQVNVGIQHNNRHAERGNSLDSANLKHKQNNIKSTTRINKGRTRSLGEEQQNVTQQNFTELHLVSQQEQQEQQQQNGHNLSLQDSNSGGSESPTSHSSTNNSPIRERSNRTTASSSISDELQQKDVIQEQSQPQQQTTTSSNPINVMRKSPGRRSSTSQILSQSTATIRNNFGSGNTVTTTATSTSLPKPSPPAWIPDQDAPRCMACTIPFTAFRRRHHCRNCGGVFCGGCSNSSAPLPKYGLTKAVRVCRDCYVREVGT